MEDRVGAVCIRESAEQENLGFWDIFLDERWLDCDIYLAKGVIGHVGYLNLRLKEKRIYEFMLRVAKEYSVLCMTREQFDKILYEHEKDWELLEQPDDSKTTQNYETDCYVIGRYKKELLEVGLFETVVESMLMQNNSELNAYLEKMLAGSKDYYELYDATQPILIYCGNEECYGVLDTMARNFGTALSEQGEQVKYFDVSQHDVGDLADYLVERFKAVIGVQTYMFSAKKKDGSFVHDDIDAPLYNFVFDHPIWFRNHLEEVPKRMTILTLDYNYVKFIEKYYGHTAMFLPPAGTELLARSEDFVNRPYDVSFVGSYGDYLASKLFELKDKEPEKAKFANSFLVHLRREKNSTPEELLWKTIDETCMECDNEQFKELLSEYRWMIYGIMNYYRKKVVHTLLEAGIELHVCGDTWKECPFHKYPNLICHDAVAGDEALKIYAQSKISLNIMSWHKDGFTERIANAMLQKSVVLTDKTTYLEENFKDGADILLFDLEEIEHLPIRIKEVLADVMRLENIGKSGYQKAKNHHTWKDRAVEFILANNS